MFRQAETQSFYNQTHIKENIKVYSSNIRKSIPNEKMLSKKEQRTQKGWMCIQNKMNIDYIMQ